MVVQQNTQERRTDGTDFEIRDAENSLSFVNADSTHTPIGQ